MIFDLYFRIFFEIGYWDSKIWLYKFNFNSKGLILELSYYNFVVELVIKKIDYVVNVIVILKVNKSVLNDLFVDLERENGLVFFESE